MNHIDENRPDVTVRSVPAPIEHLEAGRKIMLQQAAEQRQQDDLPQQQGILLKVRSCIKNLLGGM